MNFIEFVQFIKKWKQYNKYPPASGWPSVITLHKKLWEDILRLHKYTAESGYEYESSFFYVDNEIIISRPVKGEKHSVHAHHSLQIKYVPDNYKKRYERQILLDHKIMQKDYFQPDQVPKNIDSGFLFNIHTHPIHKNNNGDEVYTFFSSTDINSLLGLSTLMTGLVTDQFWLACKTDQVISRIGTVGEEMLSNITKQSLMDERHLEQVLKTEIRNWGLVIYRASFGNNLVRVA